MAIGGDLNPPDATFDIVNCPGSGPLFEAVLRLSKLAKATVGFLPDAAFRSRATSGTLLIATTDDRVAGYVLYGLPRDEIRIVQLVTDPGYQRRGIARRLVDEVADRHPSRRGILVECRRDFPVDKMWPHLQFTPVAERPGRNRQGLPLTIWFRDFGHPTLFSVGHLGEGLPVAALDANIVIDLADGVAAVSDPLTAEWIGSGVQLAITDEVFLELDKKQDPVLRTRHRRHASSLHHLHADARKWKPLLSTLRSEVANPDKFAADLRHAARAAAGGARWLVTQDGNFQRSCGAIVKRLIDIDVVSPGELLLAVDALIQDDTYRPTDLNGSSLQFRDIAPGEFEEVTQAFVNQREGETLSRLRRELSRAASATPHQRLRVLVDEGSHLGLVVTRRTNVLEIPICRVHRDKTQATVARQLVGIVRTEAADLGVPAVRLSDAHCGEWVRRAATAEGYLAAGPGFTALPMAGFGSRDQLSDRINAAISALPADAVPSTAAEIAHDHQATVATEDLFSPWRLTTDEIPTFVLSIEPYWAAELFDVDIARSHLFPRGKTLVLQREHVYYRSPSAAGGLTAPARILWYVKPSPVSQRGLRAISTLRDVVVGDPRHLFRRFKHLGAYDESQVRGTARNDRVMALRFSHTALLPEVISLEDYRDAMQAAGRKPVLQGPQRLPEHVFASLASLLA